MAEEQKPLSVPEIGDKLIGILDSLLATGNWDSSLFLKASASRLRELKDEAERLTKIKNGMAGDKGAGAATRVVPPGYFQAYILLYQVEGANLQSWVRAIKGLVENPISRPAYKDEAFAQEFIRSKISMLERHGYVVVNIKNEDIYQVEEMPVDNFGHPLIALKENAVKIENILEFIHFNKKRYSFRSGELIYIEDIT